MKVPHKLSVLLQHCLPQHLLSRIFGCLAASRITWLKNNLIQWFVKRYQIDMSTAKYERLSAYQSFNDFFTRELKPALRPVDTNPNTICSPVDASVSQFGKIHQESVLQAKGIHYSLVKLINDPVSYKPFINGHFITLYLSPRDYHRVHMPVDGTLYRADYIPGRLFSVNEVSVNSITGLFSRNERLICYFNSAIGDCILIMVGAMLVAGIETVWTKEQQAQLQDQPIPLAKGEELGRFTFGSTVILLFNHKHPLQWQEAIQPDQHLQYGQAIALY